MRTRMRRENKKEILAVPVRPNTRVTLTSFTGALEESILWVGREIAVALYTGKRSKSGGWIYFGDWMEEDVLKIFA